MVVPVDSRSTMDCRNALDRHKLSDQRAKMQSNALHDRRGSIVAFGSCRSGKRPRTSLIQLEHCRSLLGHFLGDCCSCVRDRVLLETILPMLTDLQPLALAIIESTIRGFLKEEKKLVAPPTQIAAGLVLGGEIALDIIQLGRLGLMLKPSTRLGAWQ